MLLKDQFCGLFVQNIESWSTGHEKPEVFVGFFFKKIIFHRTKKYFMEESKGHLGPGPIWISTGFKG